MGRCVCEYMYEGGIRNDLIDMTPRTESVVKKPIPTFVARFHGEKHFNTSNQRSYFKRNFDKIFHDFNEYI